MTTAQFAAGLLLVICIVIPAIVCPPVKSTNEVKEGDGPRTAEEANKLEYMHYLEEVKDLLSNDTEFVNRISKLNVTDKNAHEKEYGLEYERYLKEIFSTLEEDDTFKNKIMKDPDLQAKDISQHLDFVSHGVRTKLDEIKRQEVQRIHTLTKAKMALAKDKGRGLGHMPDLRNIMHPNDHLDISNPHSFEMKDLDRLIKKATNDLDNIDTERKKEFKTYELEKEHQRREKLAKMSTIERTKEEEHFKELKKKHADHPKLHEPGSKAQLEEVWEKDDHMDADSFDPKNFFKMHDVDGDGHLEPDEIEALVEREVAKAYEAGNEEDDLVEKDEEMMRMREDIMKRFDKDKDGSISEEEFMEMSKTKDFAQDDGWKSLEDEDSFSEEELKEYEKKRDEEEGHVQVEGHPPAEALGVVHMDQGHIPPTGGPAHGSEAQSHPDQPPAHDLPKTVKPAVENHGPPQHPPKL